MSKVQISGVIGGLFVVAAWVAALPAPTLAQTTGESRQLTSAFSICVNNGSAFTLSVLWEELSTGMLFASRTLRKGEESCQTPGAVTMRPPFRVNVVFDEAGVRPASCRSIIRVGGKSTLRAFGATGAAAGCLGTGY